MKHLKIPKILETPYVALSKKKQKQYRHISMKLKCLKSQKNDVELLNKIRQQ